MKKFLLSFLLALILVMIPAIPAFAATTADVTITVTLEHIAISDNASSYDFGTQALSATPYTSTSYVGVTNDSTVTIDVEIYVVNDTWTGGDHAWTHSDTATAGADTIGVKANAGGTWGVGDVIVKKSGSSPELIEDDLGGPGDDFDYGIKLYCPTSDTDHVQKTNDIRVEASAS